MSVPTEHAAFQYAELNKLTDTLSTLRRLGISELDPAFRTVLSARGAALGKLGLNLPRTTTLLKLLVGLSPGEIRLFQDAELGWLVESIERPGAQPVRKYVSDEVAMTLIKGKMTKELEVELMAPEEEYIA